MTERVIIEDCDDKEWLEDQAEKAKQCIDDVRIIEADEVDTWKIRLWRLEDQLKRVNGVHWSEW